MATPAPEREHVKEQLPKRGVVIHPTAELEGPANFPQAFARTAQRIAPMVAIELPHRDHVERVTYGELLARAEAAAAALASHGLAQGDRCAILDDNCVEWCASFLAILRLGAVPVPLDTHYSAQQIEGLLHDSGARILLTAPRYLESAEHALRARASATALLLLRGAAPGRTSLPELVSQAAIALPPCPATRGDPAVILYTSGTTGDPKGVVITHGNLLAEASAVIQRLRIDERDSILGVMPLFHALALMANLLLPFLYGARVIFLEELSATELLRALGEREPSAFCCVPQFFYLIHQRLLGKVAEGGAAKAAAFRALLRSHAALRRLTGLNLGRYLFRPVHALFGRHMRLLVTGGARFDPSVGRDFYGLGFNLIEVYGLTETSGAATLTALGQGGLGTAGAPLPGVAVKILPPEAGAAEDLAAGEIAIRGPIVMKEYFHRPDATAESLRDGWFLTGDLGYLDRRGNLRITGRKKEIIVLSSGKNIYPEEIEAHYAKSPSIRELCVVGTTLPHEPLAERLHGIIVPDLDVMRERKIMNLKEVLRFEIENLSVQLPAHKRILSYEIRMEPLPRTTTNKLKRHEIEREMKLRSGAAEKPAASERPLNEEAAAWAADPEAARALALIREFAHDKTALHPDANLELDLGLDSIERVEVLTHLEHLFGTSVAPEAAVSAYTVRQLVDVVRLQPGATAAAPALEAWSALFARIPADEPLFRNLLKPHPVVGLVLFLAFRLARGCAWLLLGFRVDGVEHLPAQGAYMICPNHESFLDSFLVVSALPFRIFRKLFFVGASEYFATPLRQAFAHLIHLAPVDPDTNLARALQAAAFGLQHQKALLLFPEGERSIDGQVKKFKKGAAILALHLQVPVVPAALDGVFEVWARNRPLRWRAFLPWKHTQIRLRFGPPLPPPAAPQGSPSAAQMEARYAGFAEELRSIVVQMQDSLTGSLERKVQQP